MQQATVDAVARSLVTGTSRRVVMRAVMSAAVAGALRLGAAPDVRAVTCAIVGVRCGRAGDSPCCSGRCARKKGTRKKVCHPAPAQGFCTINVDACHGSKSVLQNWLWPHQAVGVHATHSTDRQQLAVSPQGTPRFKLSFLSQGQADFTAWPWLSSLHSYPDQELGVAGALLPPYFSSNCWALAGVTSSVSSTT